MDDKENFDIKKIIDKAREIYNNIIPCSSRIEDEEDINNLISNVI